MMNTGEVLLQTLKLHGVVESTMQKLKMLRHNTEKVNFAEELLIKYHILHALNTGATKLQFEKNNSKSAEFRVKGNEFYFKKNYWQALELYNKSIAFAEADSENLSIGFANRSAVLFEAKLYKESLENIKLAKNAKYPQRLTHKIDKRAEDCSRLLIPQEYRNNESFRFTFNPHPVVPEIAAGLYIKYTEDKGRSIYTERALKVGDCISVEKPFCAVLLKNVMYARCANCNLENFGLIPCPNCTCALFCSKNCMKEAERFHKFECPIIDLLHSELVYEELRLALRLTLIALSLFETVDHFKKFYDKPQNKNQNLFTLDYKNFNEKEYFRAIWGLLTNEEKKPLEKIFVHATNIAFLRYYLLRNTPLQEMFSGARRRNANFFTEILFRHLMISFATTVLVNYDRDEEESFALVLTSFAQVKNHSCAPNTFATSSGTKLYTFAIRPIPADAEILCEYNGLNFASYPKLTRQMKLKNAFYFDCKCDACEGNYPTFDKLCNSPHVPSVPVISKKDVQLSFNYSVAEIIFPDYCSFLENYYNHYPCRQIHSIQNYLKQCLLLLVGNGSLKAKFNIQNLN